MSKPKILCIGDLDGRKRAVRRAKALARDLTAALNGKPAPHQIVQINSAAELVAIAEQLRAAHLAGDSVLINDIVRAENAASRALRAIGLPENEGQYASPTFIISEADARL